jgi:hypothetical protein
MIERERHASSWTLSPSCLIDRILDHIEKLGSVVVPSSADNRPHTGVEVEARIEQLGA